MHYKISRSDWEKIGDKMGWLKKSGRDFSREYEFYYEIENLEIPEFPEYSFFGGADVIFTVDYESSDRDYDYPGANNITIDKVVLVELQCVSSEGEVPMPAGAEKAVVSHLNKSSKVEEAAREYYLEAENNNLDIDY